MRRTLCWLIALVTLFLAGCTAANMEDGQGERYQTYKDIPGVTPEEEAAVEAALAGVSRFTYGSVLTTEAFVDENGEFSGFTALLCRRMSELFGVTFEPGVYEWNELFEGIESQEMDFTGEFTPTPERREEYYMTGPVAQRVFKVFYDARRSSLEEIAARRPIRCAFMEGTQAYARVAASWEMPFEPVFVLNSAQVIQLFINGDIDAFIEEGVIAASFDEYDFIVSEDYYPLEFSAVAITTANPDLAPIIAVMQKYLDNGGYYELSQMYNLGDQLHLRRELFMILTDEEREYIRRHCDAGVPILVASEADNYPASFYNPKDGAFQGIAVDVLEQVTALTGLTFRAGNGTSAPWSELMQGLESGEYSIVSELLQSTQRQGRFLWADQPYCTDTYTMISRADYPDVDINQIPLAKIGLIEDAAYTDIFLEWFPDSLYTHTYPAIAEAFAALENGEIDLLMGSQNLLLNLTNYQEKPGFKINVAFNYSSDSFFGFNKDEEILRSIVSKALRYIDTATITQRWQHKVFDYQSKMYKDMAPYLGIFIAVLFVAFVVVIILYVKNRQINRNLGRLVSERTFALKLQTSTLTTVFESIPDLVFCKDLDMKFTRCNRSFEKYFGCREENLLGKCDEEGMGFTYEEAERYREADRAVIWGKKTIAVEEYLPAADGSVRLFETIKTPLMQGGEPIGIMGISRDITQRRQMEKMLELTFDTIDARVHVNDVQTGEILFLNRKMREACGGGELEGRPCWEVIRGKTEGPCDICPMPKVLSRGDSLVWEEHNLEDGKYYRHTSNIIHWHDGRPVHMQHSVDVTDIKTAQTALRRRLRQQAMVASMAQSFLSDTDIGTLITEALRMAGEFMGASQVLFYKADGDAFICHNEWMDPQLGVETRIGESMVLDNTLFAAVQGLMEKKGFTLNSNDPVLKAAMLPYRKRFKSFITAPVLLQGKIYGALDFSGQDDDQQWSESDVNLVFLVASLLSGALERLSMEADLIAAKEQAEQGSRSKSDFLSRMSHEIRTPLNAVIGMIGIALSTGDMDKIRHCLGRADGASKHLLGVINDILDISKIEADKFELDYREFAFEKMLVNVTNVTNFRAEEKKQNFIVNLNSNVPAHIIGDDLRLAQVITNLLSNAVKFTPESGTITLSAEVTRDMGDEIVLRVEVADTGIGVTPEQQSRLFTSFEQADGGTARKFGGTGLGLAISKRIVEMMGGRIWIESEPGQGAKFIFTVNAQKGIEQPRTELSQKINREDLRILAVDDILETREYFTHVMDSLGLPCDVAGGGEEALAMLAACGDKPYNLFFVDWQMPEMDGVELTRRIKKITGDGSVVFMISVADWNSIEEEARSAGVKAFIPKPLFPSALVDVINECLAPEPKRGGDERDAADKDETNFAEYRILIAEDVEVNREIMSAVLEETGVAIEYAENGRAAVSMFQENPGKYALILMDIQMPEMDGYEATQTIRALDVERARDIPIIAMTANVFKEDIEHCLAVGMNDHIGKPINPDVLYEKLAQYLS